jgi:hypothetical protein
MKFIILIAGICVSSSAIGQVKCPDPFPEVPSGAQTVACMQELLQAQHQLISINAALRDAVLAVRSNTCPIGWSRMPELEGRFIIGAGVGAGLTPRPYGIAGGAESFVLGVENLPPHQHQVYPHAGMIVGPTSGTPGAGGSDPNLTSHVLTSLTGPGPGASAPVFFTPPYYPLTFCKEDM